MSQAVIDVHGDFQGFVSGYTPQVLKKKAESFGYRLWGVSFRK